MLSRTTTLALATVVLWVSTVAGEHVESLARLRVVVVVGCIGFFPLTRGIASRCVLAGACGLVGGSAAWHAVAAPVEGACGGVVTLVKDPVNMGHAVSTVVKLSGRRYSLIAHGANGWRIAPRLAGESLRLEGHCRPVSGRSARYSRISHVVGTIVPVTVSEGFSEGSMAARASNRLRAALARGVASMPTGMRSLFMGLVIGDDRDQSRGMVLQFRRSGLSHLCAVSGQNVAYLLAAMAPLLRRRRRLVRWLLTLGLIGWFAMLTRFEPSVLRAGAMAAIVATNAAIGVALNARVVLCLTVTSLLIIDPMLAWSVGFALSVGATAGLAWLSAPMSRFVRMPAMGRRGTGLNAVVCSTLAAQVGTMPVSVAVFGSVPVVSMVTNPLAIGVAGAVMMLGLPIALVASVVAPLEPAVSMLLSLPVGWVALVARVGSSLGPSGVVNWALWVAVAFAALRAWRRAVPEGDSRPTDVGTL